MTDVWFCPNCHSVNRQRDSRCYKCHTPQDAAYPGGPDVRVTDAIANRTVTRYRSTRLLAFLAATLILVVAALGFAITISGLSDVDWLRDQVTRIANGGTIDQAELARRTERLAGPTVARLVLAVAALVLFAGWLSRVIANIPALGGGRPPRTPARAFIYTLIPVWNLIKVPGMIQDALYRVEPKAGGFFMVAIAWFGLVGSWLIAFIGGWVIAIRLTTELINAGSTDAQIVAMRAYVDQAVALDLITSTLIGVGGVVLVFLMLRIERRASARDREIRAALHGLVFEPVAPDPQPAP